MLEMEMRHREELETLKQEKGSLQALVGSQSGVIRELEAQLSRATGNSTALQRQQQEMMDTVHNLLNLCSKDGGKLPWNRNFTPMNSLDVFQRFKVEMCFLHNTLITYCNCWQSCCARDGKEGDQKLLEVQANWSFAERPRIDWAQQLDSGPISEIPETA